jgi:hypothetical protein
VVVLPKVTVAPQFSIILLWSHGGPYGPLWETLIYTVRENFSFGRAGQEYSTI